jgi:tetratricopeptide (TPR) repeat protein
VILHYLKLALWPEPLVFDYSWPVARGAAQIVVPALAISFLIIIALRGLSRRAVWAFPLAWVFIILAPSSSLFPIQDLAFEHRMYLPLAAIPVVLLVGGWCLLGRMGLAAGARRSIMGGAVLLLATGAGVLTARRNADYRSDLAMWSDTVAKRPTNARAHCNFCTALHRQGKLAEAAAHCTEAIRLRPDYEKAHYNLGLIRQEQGDLEGAAMHYAKAIHAWPEYVKAHNNLCFVLLNQGKLEDAFTHCVEAVRLWPDFPEARLNLGIALLPNNLGSGGQRPNRRCSLSPISGLTS